MRIAVVGGGMAGLAAGAELHRAGFDMRVYERAPVLAEAGAGIQMTPNATKVLRAMGLEPAVAAAGFRPEAIFGLDGNTGRETFRTPLGDTCRAVYGADYLQVHRADLQSLLAGLVPVDRLHLGRECVDVEDGVDAAVLRFADGTHETADLVIAADGIRSRLRASRFGDGAPRYTGNLCWRALIPFDRPDFDLAWPGSSMWFGPGGHVVTYWVRGGRAVNVVAVHETDAWTEESWTLPSDRAELLAAYAGWHPRLLALLARSEAIFKWGLFDRDPIPSWRSKRVVLIGDAAHPMLPFLSQGAAIGLEDGYVLARALREVEGPVEAQLAAFEADRVSRAGAVQLAARERGLSYHRRSWLGRTLRDMRHRLRAWRDPYASGLEASWIYAYDATTTPLGPVAIPPIRATS